MTPQIGNLLRAGAGPAQFLMSAALPRPGGRVGSASVGRRFSGLILDFAGVALGRLAAVVVGDDWP